MPDQIDGMMIAEVTDAFARAWNAGEAVTGGDQGGDHVPPYSVRVRETMHEQHVLALTGNDNVHVDVVDADLPSLILHATTRPWAAARLGRPG